MALNHLRSTLRYARKTIVEDLLRFFGFVCTATFIIIIGSWANNELSYDKFFSNYPGVYRLTAETDYETSTTHFAKLAAGNNRLAIGLLDHAVVNNIVRVAEVVKPTIKINNEHFASERAFRADSSFFKVFNVNLCSGSAESILNKPGQVALSKKTALKHFGDIDPTGQVISLRGRNDRNEYICTVTGVFEDFPEQAHFHPEYIFSDNNNIISSFWAYTYILLKEGTDPEALLEACKERYSEYASNEFVTTTPFLQPVTDIHLNSFKDRELELNSDKKNVYIIIASIIFIYLVFFLININLVSTSTLRRINRLRVQKIYGLSVQGFNKASSISFLILLISSIVVSILSLSSLDNLIYKTFGYKIDLEIPALIRYSCLITLIGIPLLISQLFINRGIWLRISSLQAEKITSRSVSSPVFFTSQLILSLILLSCALLFGYQNKFILDLHNNEKDSDMVVILSGFQDPSRYYTFKEEVLKIPGVTDICASTFAPGQENADIFSYDYGSYENYSSISPLPASSNFIDFFDYKLLFGDHFREGDSEENSGLYIVNETAALEMNAEDPQSIIGKDFNIRYDLFPEGKIIGIIEDLHFSSLNNKEQSFALMVNSIFYQRYLIRVSLSNSGTAIRKVREAFLKVYPDNACRIEYSDEVYRNLYANRLMEYRLVIFLSVISVIVTCLGLYGISRINISWRTSEIGIRKVCGSGRREIWLLFIRKYFRSYLLSLIVALPMAVIINNYWIQWYYYRIESSLHIYLISSLITLLIVLISTSYNILSAVRQNPLIIIRNE